jgi:hypothetical protein
MGWCVPEAGWADDQKRKNHLCPGGKHLSSSCLREDNSFQPPCFWSESRSQTARKEPQFPTARGPDAAFFQPSLDEISLKRQNQWKK